MKYYPGDRPDDREGEVLLCAIVIALLIAFLAFVAIFIHWHFTNERWNREEAEAFMRGFNATTEMGVCYEG